MLRKDQHGYCVKRRLERTRMEMGKFAQKSRDCANGQEHIETRAGPWALSSHTEWWPAGDQATATKWDMDLENDKGKQGASRIAGRKGIELPWER